jgi:hypothetical protein
MSSTPNFIPFNSVDPYDQLLPVNQQKTREIKPNFYSKPVYDFCMKYNEFHSGYKWVPALDTFDSELSRGEYDNNNFYINMNIFTWEHLLVAEYYIQKHKQLYSKDVKGGRRRSKKRPTARRRRSSKARNSRKSRKSRNTRRR